MLLQLFPAQVGCLVLRFRSEIALLTPDDLTVLYHKGMSSLAEPYCPLEVDYCCFQWCEHCSVLTFERNKMTPWQISSWHPVTLKERGI